MYISRFVEKLANGFTRSTELTLFQLRFMLWGIVCLLLFVTTGILAAGLPWQGWTNLIVAPLIVLAIVCLPEIVIRLFRGRKHAIESEEDKEDSIPATEDTAEIIPSITELNQQLLAHEITAEQYAQFMGLYYPHPTAEQLEMPEPMSYKERKHWKDTLELARRPEIGMGIATVVAVILVVVWVTGVVGQALPVLLSFTTGWLAVFGGFAYFAFRHYWAWFHEILEVTETKVTWSRPGNKWLFISPTFFDINVWQVENCFLLGQTVPEQWIFRRSSSVTINGSGDADYAHFANMRNILDFERLKETIENNKLRFIMKHSTRLS